ncbi:MAG: type I 3-dehydroquinate dehydratase [Sporolactobacillus sp.]
MSEHVLNLKGISIGAGIPKIIIPLVGSDKQKIQQEAALAMSLQPDAIEWRVDAFEQANDLDAVKDIIARLHKQFADILLLVTFRSKKEGGKQDIDPEDYVILNKVIVETHQVDLIDVELFTGEAFVRQIVSCAHANNVRVVMSSHDFEKTPAKADIISRLRKMQAFDADIPKIAVMPKQKADVLILLEATAEMNDTYADRPIITMSMGGLGAISRLSGEIFGSSMTFGSGEKASAPGQIPVHELRKALRIIHDSQ